MPQIDNMNLALELSAGSQKAFNAVFRAYYGKVVNFIESLVKSRIVAEDLSQEVFVNLWNSRHALGGGALPQCVYLYGRPQYHH